MKKTVLPILVLVGGLLASSVLFAWIWEMKGASTR